MSEKHRKVFSLLVVIVSGCLLIQVSDASPASSTSAPSKSPVTPISTTTSPTVAPTRSPTASPVQATVSPTASPGRMPTVSPSVSPVQETASPTVSPAKVPTASPLRKPTVSPTASPVEATVSPTVSPVKVPTASPFRIPTVSPTASPVQATVSPTVSPVKIPTTTPTASPVKLPTVSPTASPVTSSPTRSPVALIVLNLPTAAPTQSPSAHPTSFPTSLPTRPPTSFPTRPPTEFPTSTPTKFPTRTIGEDIETPTRSPTQGLVPTGAPIQSTDTPTFSPTPGLNVTDVIENVGGKNQNRSVDGNGTSASCLESPNLETLDIAALAIGVISMTASCAGFIGVTYYRKRAVMKFSVVQMLQYLCFGLTLWNLALIFRVYSGRQPSEDKTFCLLSRWFQDIGFVVAMSPLIIKALKVYRHFDNPTLKRVRAPKNEFHKFTFLLSSIMTVILILWSAIAAPRVDPDAGCQCESPGENFGAVFYTLSAAYQVLLTFGGLVMGCRTKLLGEVLSESRAVTKTLTGAAGSIVVLAIILILDIDESSALSLGVRNLLVAAITMNVTFLALYHFLNPKFKRWNWTSEQLLDEAKKNLDEFRKARPVSEHIQGLFRKSLARTSIIRMASESPTKKSSPPEANQPESTSVLPEESNDEMTVV